MQKPKRALYSALKEEVRTIVGSTDFILEQIGEQLFHLQIPPGLCWRCPDHPQIDLQEPPYVIIPRLKETFGIA